MKKKQKKAFCDTGLGKDLAHMIILPIALKASSHSHRSRFKDNSVQLYERLRCLKDSLRMLIIGDIPETSSAYRSKLQSKILTEKLILNIVSGRRADILKNIEQIMQSEGINFVERHQSPISPEERYVIKCDFNGIPHSPKNLSPFYQNLLLQPSRPSSYLPQDYKLQNIPDWKIYRQFPNFKNNEYKLRQALSEKGVPPQMLSSLNAYDIMHLFSHYYKKHKIYPPETSKVKFIKFFIRHHEQAFRTYLNNSRPVIIEALKNKGINISDHPKSDDYRNFVESSIRLMKEKGTVPPLFNIHHKIPVKDSNDPDKLSRINSPQNLCLIMECPYHTMMHLFDTNSKGDTIFDRKVKRVELPQDMIFFGGFRSEACIYHNYSLDYQKNLHLLIAKVTGKRK